MQILQILNILNFAIPLLWLVAILAYRLKFGEVRLKWVKAGIFSVLALFIAAGANATVTTYDLWSGDPVSRFFLPPHTPISYFYGYALFHFWRAYGIIIMLSLVWAFTLWLINKLSGRDFLDRADICLGFFASLSVGWPKFIFLLAIFFGLMVLRQIIDIAVFKKNEPLDVAPYLAAAAIIALIAGEFLINRSGLEVLRI